MDESIRPPLRLRSLVSWQANKVATLGARLFSARMPLSARADFALLAALEEFGAMSQADLGRTLGLDRNDVSTVLRRLDAARQVRRRPDADDQRRNVVSVTAAGRRHLAALQALADEVQAELLAGLREREQRQLVDLMSKIITQHPSMPA